MLKLINILIIFTIFLVNFYVHCSHKKNLIDSEEYKQFVILVDQSLERYEKLPPTTSKRKVMGGSDNNGLGNNVIFFKGSREFGQSIIDYLKSNQNTSKLVCEKSLANPFNAQLLFYPKFFQFKPPSFENILKLECTHKKIK